MPALALDPVAPTAVGLGAIAYFERGAPASTSNVLEAAQSLTQRL